MKTGWWQIKYFSFSSGKLGKWSNLTLTTFFSDGLKSPTRKGHANLDHSLGQETSHDHNLAGPSTWTTFTSFTRFFHEIREVSWRSPEPSILFGVMLGGACDFGMAKLDKGMTPPKKKQKERMSSEKKRTTLKRKCHCSNHQFAEVILVFKGGRSVKVLKFWSKFSGCQIMGGLTNTPSLNLPKRWYVWAFFDYNDLHPKSFWEEPCLAILWDLRQCDFSKYVGTTRFKFKDFKAPCAKHFNSSTAYLLDILYIC